MLIMATSVLAMSMLPDGAETQLDDWTVFFLNQTPFNTIQPVLALDDADTSVRSSVVGDQPDLLCVLNLVRTKHDKTWERCAAELLYPSTSLTSPSEERKCSPLPYARVTPSSKSSKCVCDLFSRIPRPFDASRTASAPDGAG